MSGRGGTNLTTWARLLVALSVVAAATGEPRHLAAGDPQQDYGDVARPRSHHPHKSVQPSIWFHPLPSAAAWPNGPDRGSTDFLALFHRNAAWPRAMAHVSVVGMYAGWITAVSDEELQHTVAFLNARHMGI